MPTVLNDEFSSIINSKNYLSQYIGSKDFPLNLDEQINGEQFISYLNYRFNNQTSYNIRIFDCKSNIFRRATRIFAEDSEDFYKACGNQHESDMKGNKIIYFSIKYIYNLIYLKDNNNKFDVNKHVVAWSSVGDKYNLLYSLYFVNYDTANIIKNDEKYAGLINYQYRSGNVLNVYEAIFIDWNRYFLGDFKDCQVVQVLLKKTCYINYISFYNKVFGTTSKKKKFSCQEKISERRCINLQDLLPSSSAPVIRHNNKLSFSDNSQINNNSQVEKQFSNSDAVALLVSIFATIMATIVLTIVFVGGYIYRKCNLHNKDASNARQQKNNEIIQAVDESILFLSIEQALDKDASVFP